MEIRCETCTRERYGISDDETLAVYVEPRKAPEKPKAKKAATKKAVKCSVCQGKGHLYTECPLLVGQGDLFDGA